MNLLVVFYKSIYQYFSEGQNAHYRQETSSHFQLQIGEKVIVIHKISLS